MYVTLRVIFNEKPIFGLFVFDNETFSHNFCFENKWKRSQGWSNLGLWLVPYLEMKFPFEKLLRVRRFWEKKCWEVSEGSDRIRSISIGRHFRSHRCCQIIQIGEYCWNVNIVYRVYEQRHTHTLTVKSQTAGSE